MQVYDIHTDKSQTQVNKKKRKLERNQQGRNVFFKRKNVRFTLDISSQIIQARKIEIKYLNCWKIKIPSIPYQWNNLSKVKEN